MRLGKYEVLDQIGIGGFGRVLLARDPDAVDPTEQLVAIKRLRRTRAQRRGSLDAIINEARIGSYLHHPNIVRVIELAQVGRDLLLVMEFINGIGLDELLHQQRLHGSALPLEVALEIGIQAGEGLHYAHGACSAEGEPLHIRHRDIKPSNIMICRKGKVRVMDFGVALTALPRVQTTTGTIKGTLRYLSPEQAQGTREIGPETDQFALGLVLAEMLIGRPVYDATQDHQVLLRALRGQVEPGIEAAAAICPELGPILSRAMALLPQDRYPDTGELVRALRELKAREDRPVDLAYWVHQGLEERARLAAEDSQAGGSTDLSDLTGESQEKVEVQRSGLHSDTFPMGWANEHLSAVEESGEHSAIDEEGGWAIEPGQDLSAPVLARTPGGEEGWAMVSEEEHFDVLRREPLSDEWLASMLPAREARGSSTTNLSLEMQSPSNEPDASGHGADRPTSREVLEPSGERARRGVKQRKDPPAAMKSDGQRAATKADVSQPAKGPLPESGKGTEHGILLPFVSGEDSSGQSPTAYAVKRPGRDRVVVRSRVVANPSSQAIQSGAEPLPGGPMLESVSREELRKLVGMEPPEESPAPVEAERKGLRTLLRWLVKPR